MASVKLFSSNIVKHVRLRCSFRTYASSSFGNICEETTRFNGTVGLAKCSQSLTTFGRRPEINLIRSSISSQRRNVVTLSPLGVAFNTKPERGHFPSFKARTNVGLFRIPELTDYTGFYLLLEKVRARTEELVNEASDANRKRAIVNVFDELSDCLCRVADMADFARTAHPDPKFSQAADEVCQAVSSLVETLNVNVDIYRSLKKVLDDGDTCATDHVDRHVAELFLFDFEQSGIHLDEKKRGAFVALNESILTLGLYFMRGSQCGVSVDKSQLPAHLRDVFTSDSGDRVMVTGLFSESADERVREAAYRIYLYPEQQQQERLESLLAARFSMAQLAGFQSYGHRALRGTMGGTPERVMDFLQLLADKVRPTAEKDLAYLTELKRSTGAMGRIQPWDTSYYGGIARQQKCLVTSAELAPYFSLGSCMEGLSNLFSCLYDVTLNCEQADYGELWSDDVQKVAVVHRVEGTLGHVYCDFYERTGKPRQDCHFTIQGGRLREDGTYQRPIVVLMLNLPRPRGGTPSLLTHGMVENMFHEFGHAMHSMLGRTRFQHVTGTRCPTDFAEVPSVLMEYFANDPRVLSSFARHWQTGEALSDGRIEQLCRAKRMFNSSETQLQVFYSILDQVYHGVHPLGKSTTDVLADVQNRFYCLPYVDGTAWQLRFSHFVGYGAKYYSYLMSRAVASQIWQRCFKDDPFSSSMGSRYRTQLLSHGGETPAAELVENMLQEAPTTSMLVGAMVEDLESQSDYSR